MTEDSRDQSKQDPSRYDVVILGGGFAGASSALLLRRWRPQARILVVDDPPKARRKVGEATVEVSAFFLHRILGLYDYLSREQLPKHGLRFWSAEPGATAAEQSLAEMSESGPQYLPKMPTFQLDRGRLDGQLLELARAEGCEVMQPARVKQVELGWPASRVEVEREDGGEGSSSAWVTARWVIDATGRRALLARRLGLYERVESHPTAAVWGRWQGVADLDGREVMGPDPCSSRLPGVQAARRLATNHFCGYGWWCWVIPLAGGQTSIGLVWDKSLFQLEGEGDVRRRYEAFLRSRPGLEELVRHARLDEEDWLSYSHLPYRSHRYMDAGWALVGDAASFIDPFYSPGLDHASFSIYSTARLIDDDLRGDLPAAALEERVRDHNERFRLSYDRWLEALYLGKYELFGDAELITSAFLVDTATYFLGVVQPVYRDAEAFKNPPFGGPLPQARYAYLALRTFNRRLQALARQRRRLGLYGRRNRGWHLYPPGFGLGRDAVGLLGKGLRLWLRLEAQTLWHRCFGRRPRPATSEAAAIRPLEPRRSDS